MISHTMKLWERVVERVELALSEQPHGFMPGKSSPDALLALRKLAKVPREEVWYCMRKSGLAEKYIVKYVRIVQYNYV